MMNVQDDITKEKTVDVIHADGDGVINVAVVERKEDYFGGRGEILPLGNGRVEDGVDHVDVRDFESVVT